jgi:glycolate oxidase
MDRQGTRERIEELARELDFLHGEDHYRLAYRYDATGIKGRCGGVAFPRGLDDLLMIVDACLERGIPLFARGAGTGFSGGAVPGGDGIVISTERMNRILRFDQENEEVEVESGVVNQDLQDHLAPIGYFYPPDPASLKSSTIGGNIAENAGGPRAYKYGVTRRYVRSLTWIAPGIGLVSSPTEGGSSLLVGSEGTLGIVYSARLSVLQLPRSYGTSILEVPGEEEAVRFALHLMSSGLYPCVIEYIDGRTMRCVGEYKLLEGLSGNAGYIFLEIDGSSGEVEEHMGLLARLCREADVRMRSARSGEEREFMWEMRRAISPSLARRGVTKVNEDVSLPLGRLGEAVSFIHRLAEELSLDCYIFGHCGDGNLHVNIMTDRRRTAEMKRVELFVDRLFRRVVELGGTLSGEHGIGMTKSRFLGYRFSPAEMELQRRVKSAIDPNGLINPGKYFSGGSEECS